MLPRVDPVRDPLIAAIALDFIPVSLVLPPPMKAYLVLEKQRALLLAPPTTENASAPPSIQGTPESSPR